MAASDLWAVWRVKAEMLKGMVRPVCAVLVVLTACIAFLGTDKLTSNEFLTLGSMVVGVFFGSRQPSK